MASFSSVSNLKLMASFKTMWKIRGVKIRASVKKDLVNQFDPQLPEDVIGKIVEVSPIDVVSFNGKDTNKMALELRNSADERLQTVLWGSFAMDVMEAIQMRREHAIIYERSISNAYNVSAVELNPPMAEDLIATKLAQPANIYNSIMYSLEFSLINLEYTHIQCVAYGALAHRLNAFWRANTADVVVTVLRLWRIEWGEGGFNYVTNMEGGSDILFDSNIPEIQFFKSQIPSIDF
ncbi:hypothetical protein F2Q68_00024743 [Brassica cretica]|uniref:Replication protein A OB domain-containing protein n=1 Tax=Brassica cretica TaxID=69181 RepID=A0A8S9IAR7_BRACR|nr:hypothetical protein F2Q68_00024743 [Brassica cretica]